MHGVRYIRVISHLNSQNPMKPKTKIATERLEIRIAIFCSEKRMERQEGSVVHPK
jgi:hypothetical protein